MAKILPSLKLPPKISLKRFLPQTLFGRALLILVTPIILIQFITAYMFFDRHWSRMTTRLAFAVSGEVTSALAVLRESGNGPEFKNLQRFYKDYLGLDIRFDAQGALPPRDSFYDQNFWDASVVPQLRQEIKAQISEPFILRNNAFKEYLQVVIAVRGGVLSVNVPERRLFSSTGFIFLIWTVSTSLMLMLVAVIFMRNQIRPIRKLAVAAERFGKGRDTPSFKPQGALEVRQAAHAFLDMRRRIQRQISQRTEFLAGVSHDLRTPLTRMKLQMALLPDGPDKAGLTQDIHDMETMIQAYLDFVRGDGEEQFSSIDLAAFVAKIAEGFRRQNADIQMAIPVNLRLLVRPLAFERALTNLLGNAARYGRHVWVEARVEDKKVHIQIDDDGPGIAEDMFEHVLKPFARIEQSRNAETGGIGLGLPIALDIIHAHGGKMLLGRSPRGGLSVAVRMPY